MIANFRVWLSPFPGAKGKGQIQSSVRFHSKDRKILREHERTEAEFPEGDAGNLLREFVGEVDIDSFECDFTKTKPTWILLGVDESNWWNEFVLQDVQLVVSGATLTGFESRYYLHVMDKRMNCPNDFVCVRPGVLLAPIL